MRLVHFLLFGHALCGAGMPNEWPPEDRWVSHNTGTIHDVTCMSCRVEYHKRYDTETEDEM